MSHMRVALMGLSGAGEAYARTICASDDMELIAVADGDPAALRRIGLIRPVPTFDDYRSFIMACAASQCDLLIVATEPFESAGVLDAAARRCLPVLHKAPYARNIREAERTATAFAAASVPLLVAQPWKYASSMRRLLDAMADGMRFDAARVEIKSTTDGSGWRGDRAKAGGGVLLNGAYDMLDILVTVFGLPESVYARCRRSSATRRAYDTEDVACLLMGYEGNGVADLFAVRGAATDIQEIELVGSSNVSVADSLRFGCGSWTDGSSPSDALASMLGNFAEELRSEQGLHSGDGRHHLRVTAVVEAAYLSAQTGESESPRKLLPEGGA